MNFQGRKAAASMALKAKTDARFELSGPSYLLVQVFKAAIGPIGPVKALEKLVSYKRRRKVEKKDFCPVRLPAPPQ